MIMYDLRERKLPRVFHTTSPTFYSFAVIPIATQPQTYLTNWMIELVTFTRAARRLDHWYDTSGSGRNREQMTSEHSWAERGDNRGRN